MESIYIIKLLTNYGDMLVGIKNHIEKAVSIEIDEALLLAAKDRFKSDEHIEVILCDSSTELASIIKGINKPILFFWMPIILDLELERVKRRHLLYQNYSYYKKWISIIMSFNLMMEDI